MNIWPVKPFETVMVIKGYTNKIEFKVELRIDSSLTISEENKSKGVS